SSIPKFLAVPIPSWPRVNDRRLQRSMPPALPVSKVLDDDNLLIEILVRLPPKPSSLPRASAVSKRWGSILSDPVFHKRFRKHHQKPPLLGFFNGCANCFTPIMGSPDRIPAARFSLPKSAIPYNDYGVFRGCRHGLAVLIDGRVPETVVWDPLTSEQHIVPFPQGLDDALPGYLCTWHGAVLCADADDGHVHGDCFSSPFKLVLVCCGGHNTHAFCSVHDSASRVWGDVFSTVITNRSSVLIRPNILGRNALCWLISQGGIFVLDFKTQSLDVIEKPVDCRGPDGYFQLLRMEDGGLGLAVLLNLTIQLWERKSNCNGIVEWLLLRKTIPLEGMFPRKLDFAFFIGYDEDTNVIVLSTIIGQFMLQLDLMQSKHIVITNNSISYGTFYPYSNFYTAVSNNWKVAVAAVRDSETIRNN
uniref:Uncharacterized protein n=1 Tax=Aegilops tauschii subsp. strangulata TaxID=200361 RepID=A0A453MPJ4_AEGTS